MLGNKVKLLRKEMRITQQQLASIIGVSQSTIGMIEGNKQGASNDTLLKLANALNTTIDNLLSSDINETYINDKNNINLNDQNNVNLNDKNNINANNKINIKEIQVNDRIKQEEINDDDIRRIERARKKMDPKNKEKMMNILRSAFDEYFDD